jgi:hypothetical protein
MSRIRSLRRRPAVEPLEARLTPAQVGPNDFRLSFTGNDGDPSFNASAPAVAYNGAGNQYLVVWTGNDTPDKTYEVFGQRLSAATGAPLGGKIPLSDTAFGADTPAVAYNGAANEYLVVWAGDDNVGQVGQAVYREREIFGQRVSAATGEKIGPEIRLSDTGPNGNLNFEALNPAVAYNSRANEYLVVWRGDDDTAPLKDNEFEVFGQRLNAAGEAVGANDFRLSDMGPDGDPSFEVFEPKVAYNGTNNEYLVVWQGQDNTGALVNDEDEIFGQRLNAAGEPVGANDFRISFRGPDGDPGFGAFEPAVAYNSRDNEYLVVWRGEDDTAPLKDLEFEVFGQRLSAATGALLGGAARLSDMGPPGDPRFQAFNPAVAYNGARNEYLVAWEGDKTTDEEIEIFGQRVDAATGAEIGADFRLSDMGPDGNANFAAFNPAVAYNGTNNQYLVVWQGDDTTDDKYEIFGQRFSPVDPPPPAPAPAPPQIAAVPFRKRGVSRVRVRDAATGALRAVLTPFKGFGGRLRLQLVDVTGDGALDLVVRAVVRGKRRKRVYDAVTLAPLPPNRA